MAEIFNIGEFVIRNVPDRRGFACSYGGDKSKECNHVHTTYDDNGNIVTCDDCGKQLDAYWVMKNLLRHYKQASDRLRSERESLNADLGKAVVLRAAQKVETAWRRREYIPTCPHCRKPITPTDGFGGGFVSKHYADISGQTALPMEMRPQPIAVKSE